MKKLLFAIVVLGLVSLDFAGNLITNTDVFEQKSAYASRTLDTLTASDSQTILTKWTPGSRTGKFYYLANNSFTGTGSDSVVMCIYSDEYDYRDSLLGRIFIDSLKSAGNIKTLILPVSNGLPGSKHTIKSITVTGSGSQIITNGWNIMECEPINK